MNVQVNSVKMVKKFLNNDICKRLIEEHNKSDKFTAKVDGEKSYHYSNPTECDFLSGIEILLKIEIDKYIEDNNINDFPNYKAGDFKVIEYQNGDWFTEHYDGDFSVWPEGGYKYHPFTTDIALNNFEDYEGGIFNCSSKSLKMDAGDLLIFPSSFSFRHGVEEITGGSRYVLVSEPYSLEWGLQNKVTNIKEVNSEKTNTKREGLLGRSLGLFRGNDAK